jgi:hypothetical protein
MMMKLALALLVTRVRADHPKTTAPLDVSAMHANFLYGSFDLHTKKRLEAPRYSRPAAVRIKLQLHAITDEHFDSMQTHFAREVRKYRVTGLELYAKERIRERLVDDSLYYNLTYAARALVNQSAVTRTNHHLNGNS